MFPLVSQLLLIKSLFEEFFSIWYVEFLINVLVISNWLSVDHEELLLVLYVIHGSFYKLKSLHICIGEQGLWLEHFLESLLIDGSRGLLVRLKSAIVISACTEASVEGSLLWCHTFNMCGEIVFQTFGFWFGALIVWIE